MVHPCDECGHVHADHAADACMVEFDGERCPCAGYAPDTDMNSTDQLEEAGEKFRGSRAMLEEDQRTLAALIREAHEGGATVTQIAQRAGVSRPTVYKALRAQT